MNTSSPPDHITALVDKFLSDIGEHASSAVVMLEVPCDECHGANVLIEGTGSPMARIGMARFFLLRDEAQISADEMTRAEMDAAEGFEGGEEG